MKEQLLERVRASGGRVVGCALSGAGGVSLRSREQFVEAMRLANPRLGALSGESIGAGDAVAPTGSRVGAVVSAGSDVAVDATVLDALVMPGAVVGAGSVVARSLLLPGAAVPAGAAVVDAVVTRGGATSGDAGRSGRRKRA